MLNKLIINISMSIILFVGAPLFSLENPNNASSTQREINTLDDFVEIEKTLLEAVKLGDTSKTFVLGSLYMENFAFKKRDTEKAKFYLEKALNDGYGLAALPLSYISIESNNLDSAILVLERGIISSNNDLNSQVILSVFYNGLILDYKSDDLRYIHKSLDLTYPISQKINKPALDFTIANLLNLSGNTSEANKYLNTACNNPSIDKELKESCNNSAGITNNIKKSQECDTCGVLK